VNEIAALIQNDARGALYLNGERTEIMLVPLPQFQITVGYVDAPDLAPAHAQSIVLDLASHPDFLSARLFDGDFERWQNEESLDSYRAEGRSTAGLTIGRHPAFNEDVVLTSANPGRLKYRLGYKEAIGFAMWLGERFWEIAGGDKDALQTLGNVDSVRGLTRVVFPKDEFLSDVELQKRLRVALFGTA
jgi:hypothetical protein